MSIQLAANGLPDLYALLEAGETLPLDAIKCPLSPHSRAEVERALQSTSTVLLHGWGPPGYSVTRPEIPEPELLRELCALSGTPYLSVHLDPDAALDGSPEGAKVLDRIAEQAEKLREVSGVPLLIENMPWRPGTEEIGALRPRLATDPAFIAAALEASGAGLLLDLAHASVACFHRGDDVYRYLETLPLHLVQELHVSGPRLEADGLRDRHLTLRPDDWELLAWTLERAPKLAGCGPPRSALPPKAGRTCSETNFIDSGRRPGDLHP
jgi:uncharacterized protein